MTRRKYNKNGRKGRAPKRGRGLGGAIGVGGARLQRLYIEKSRFPAMPREFEVALPYFYHDERTGGQTTQANRRFCLAEFDTILPRYCAELYQIYRHARIMAIDIHVEIVNTSSTEPLLAAIGVLPVVNVAAITDPRQIISVPGSVMRQIGLSTGMSRTSISKRYVTEKMLGELTIGSNTYLQTYSEALSAAVWTELPAIYAGVIAARTGATWTGIIDYRVTYHLRFSELNVPTLGLVPNGARYAEDQDKPPRVVHKYYRGCSELENHEMEDSEDPEWVQPPLVNTKKMRAPSHASNRTAK